MDTCQAEVLCATQRRKGYCRLNIAYHTVGSEIRVLLDGIRLDALAETSTGKSADAASSSSGEAPPDA